MLRRNSSGFGFGRQGLARSESKSSLRKEVASEESHAVPSPVAESPVREAAAVAAEVGSPYVTVGPSPLSQPAPDGSPAPPAPAPAAPSAPVASPAPIAPAAPTAPPTFVAEPEPIIQETSSPQSAAPVQAAVVEPTVEPVPAPAPVPVAPISQLTPAPETRPAVVSPSESTVTTPAPPPPVQERAADYFAWGDKPEIAKKKQSSSTIATQDSVPVRSSTPAPAAVPAVEPPPVPATSSDTPAPQVQQAYVDPYDASAADSYAWKDDVSVPSAKSAGKQPSREQFVASPEQSSRALSKSPSREQLVASPHSVALTLSPKGSRSSIASSYGQVVNVSQGRRRVSVSVDPEEGRRGRSRSKASIR